VRRWSDAGRLRVFTTLGGHRRFSRVGLERLLPADRSHRPSLGSAGLTATRIARTYRRARRDVSAELPWVLALTDEQRTLFRERGQVLAARMLQYLDAPSLEAATDHLREATSNAADYGRVAAAHGLSLSQTVEGFLRFRAPSGFLSPREISSSVKGALRAVAFTRKLRNSTALKFMEKLHSS